MTPRPDPLDDTALRELCEKAANGPWAVRQLGHAAREAIPDLLARIATLSAQVAGMRGALVDTAASLAAAISLLERGGKAAKKAAPSDKMFDQMLVDYQASLERARAALTESTPHAD